MKKLLWICGIICAVIVAALLVITIVVKNYLKSEKLKSLIIPKVEELTGRKADIEGINVSIFKGIIVKGISLKEQDGSKDFITTREFVLDYSLSRLLKKEIVIKRIEVVSPYVSITREKDGRYNFSDIGDKLAVPTKERTESKGEKEKGFPFSVIADRIYVRDATVEFRDDRKELPDVVAKADMEMMSPVGSGQKGFVPAGSLTLKEMKASMKGIETKTKGKIEANRESITIDLSTSVDKDVIKLSGSIKDYLTSPDAKVNLYAKELDLDRLLPPAPEKRTAGERKKEGGATSEKKSKEKGKTEGIKASGEIKVDIARYKGYIIKGFHLNYRYTGGVMIAEPLEMRFGGGEKIKAEGNLKGNLQFNYDSGGPEGTSGIKRTLSGKGVLDLAKCEVRQSKITEAIALFTGIDDLKSPNFESARFNWNIRSQRLSLDGNMNSSQLRINPAGNIDFDERIDLTMDLMLSPSLTAKLPARNISGYLTDEKGWALIPLKIGGTIEKPSVKLNPAAMGGQIQKGIQGEMERRLFKTPQKKGEQQPSKETKPQDLLKGIFGK